MEILDRNLNSMSFPVGGRVSDELLDHAVERLRATQSSPSAPCKVCGGSAIPFDMVDFSKSCEGIQCEIPLAAIPVVYRMCGECQFIFTDFFDNFTSEQWRRYIYNDDYIRVDPEYLDIRPRRMARVIGAFLSANKGSYIGLDYGGGSGLTASLLRERGFAFDSFDPFGHTEMSPERIGHFNFCSAIEVFEHTTDPMGTLHSIVEKASSGRMAIMISTAFNDSVVSGGNRLASWSYAAPRNGHVSLYSRKSWKVLGDAFGLTLACLSAGPFLLTRGISEGSARAMLVRGKLLRRLRSAGGLPRSKPA